jgi:hypothetical protein
MRDPLAATLCLILGLVSIISAAAIIEVGATWTGLCIAFIALTAITAGAWFAEETST